MGEPRSTRGIDALEEIWGSTIALTEPLTAQQWSASTDCPGWDVKDHLSHMIGTERSMNGEATPEISDEPPSYVKNAIGEANERWVVSRRPHSGTQVRDEFIEVTTKRVATLRSLDAEGLEHIGWSPIGQVPLRVFLEVRAMDCWVHEQDIRLALGLPEGRGGLGEEVSLFRVEQALGQIFGRGVKPPEGTSISLSIDGPFPRNYRIEIVEGRARALEGSTSSVSMTLDSLTYLLRFSGRLATQEVLSEKATRLSGDAGLGEAFVGALALMI